MRFALMIEGQEDVTWADWVALAETCERLGIEALFRSDHYLSVMNDGTRGSLDAWGTINALAAITSTVRLGTMVSPATFRHPSVLAKLATTADHVSGGRIELGLGTGWHEAEHRAYGFPFPSMRDRMDALGEQLEIVHRSWEPAPFSFDGRHYKVEELDALPKPVQEPHPTLISGGTAGPRGSAFAARWCDEYNVLYVTPEDAAGKREAIHAACRDAGRDPSTMVVSMMNAVVLGRDRDEVQRRSDALGETRDAWIVGTPEEVIERLREYERAGIQRLFLQHLLHRDFDMLELFAAEVMPALRA